MNPGRQQFLTFILERVQSGEAAAAEALLTENFRRQAEGSFTPADMLATQAALSAMVKPEHADELARAFAHFAAQMGK